MPCMLRNFRKPSQLLLIVLCPPRGGREHGLARGLRAQSEDAGGIGLQLLTGAALEPVGGLGCEPGGERDFEAEELALDLGQALAHVARLGVGVLGRRLGGSGDAR
jgi:hypothetical protein